jgi:hypothetical protein
MNDVDFSDAAAAVPSGMIKRPAAGNGTHRSTKKKSKSEVQADAEAGPQPMTAGFLTSTIEPVDAPMWPIHAALWLQSEQAPSIPAWTGLAVERHHRIPAPDFLHAEHVPFNQAGVLESSRDMLLPVSHGRFPESDLAPLGWDPRTVARRQEDQ